MNTVLMKIRLFSLSSYMYNDSKLSCRQQLNCELIIIVSSYCRLYSALMHVCMSLFYRLSQSVLCKCSRRYGTVTFCKVQPIQELEKSKQNSARAHCYTRAIQYMSITEPLYLYNLRQSSPTQYFHETAAMGTKLVAAMQQSFGTSIYTLGLNACMSVSSLRVTILHTIIKSGP